uniref:anthrax toxin receptor-like isoform X2 n=1 Tax=Ictidomys tridecemlineatus TaxID=43179 RepID=UPI001A9E77FA|nr:anthrax toxin receptor-like isoform X2 [Ictidomys tridecemlineatus]
MAPVQKRWGEDQGNMHLLPGCLLTSSRTSAFSFHELCFLFSAKVRISYILFGTEATTKMSLTSNRNTMRYNLDLNSYLAPKGETNLQEGLKKANEQIQNANSGDTKVSSIIIVLLTGEIKPQALQESKEEADKARGMGAYIYCIGMDSYKLNQMQEIADSPEHILEVKKSPEQLHDLVDLFGTKTCLELRSVEPSPLCVEGSKPVILKGYGFNNGKTNDQIICRFKFSDSKVIDFHPTAMNMTSLTCPKPDVQLGETITVEVSLNNGRNFLYRPIPVNTTMDCAPPLKPVITEYPTYPPEVYSPAPMPPRPNITPPPKPATPATPPPTTTAQAITPSPTFIYVEADPTPEEKLLTLVLSLLLIPVVLWWIWWLCFRKAKPPPPQIIEKLKEKPPPPPAPPVNVCPTIILCCCACRGVSVNRGLENKVTLRNLDQACCRQLPLTWPQEAGNLALMPNLCTQTSSGSAICLQPSQGYLPITYCSQCHPQSTRCSSPPSRILRMLPAPSQATRRTVYSLPPP